MAKKETELSRTDVVKDKEKSYPIVKPQKKAGQMLGVLIDRTGWADVAALLTLSLEISMDGGATWRHWCGYTDRGGITLGPDSQPIPSSLFVATAPPDGALVRVTAKSNGRPVAQKFSFVEVD